MALNCKAVLLDIEGTTTSISFVKDTLFPYAAKNCENYLNENWTTEETKAVVNDLVALSKKDVSDGVEEACEIKESDDKTEFISALFKNIEWQMSKDRKSSELKQLQGLIWKKAYEDASVKGHVFDDVQKNFETWTTDGLKLYIFSSGSVTAQKLLFSHSEHGDLSKYLSGYYDTKVGPKQDLESYKKIASEIGLKEEEILFLTDIVKEAEAAESAGFKVALLSRPGNSDFDDESKKKYTILKTFDDLKITTQTSAKRKIEVDGKVADEEVAPSKIAKTETDGEKADEKPATEIAQKSDVKVSEKVADDAMEIDAEETKKINKKPEEKELEKESVELKEKSTEEIKIVIESDTKETTTDVVEKTDVKLESEEKTVEPEVSENVPKEKQTVEAMEVDGTVKSKIEKSSTDLETKEEKMEKITESAGESSKETETVIEKPSTETTTEKKAEEATKSVEPEITEKVADKESEDKKTEKIEPEPEAETSESNEVANGHGKSEVSENGSTTKTEANGEKSATVENGKTTDLNGDNKAADENETIVAPKETVDPKDSALVAVDYKRKQVMAYVAKDDVAPSVEAES